MYGDRGVCAEGGGWARSCLAWGLQGGLLMWGASKGECRGPGCWRGGARQQGGVCVFWGQWGLRWDGG